MRTEQDNLGKKQLDTECLYGIHTARALENFGPQSNETHDAVLFALCDVKLAAAEANCRLGHISAEVNAALKQAGEEIVAGVHRDHFPLSWYQGGAGTSFNMNINEVLANRGLEILGYSPGEYAYLDPLEVVNLHQSTNDVFPTAVKIALIRKLRILSRTVATLQEALQKKEHEYARVITMGRTQMQDAVPITVGAQFASFAAAIERDRWRCFKAEERIRLVNIGGTAVGTGVTAPRKYIYTVLDILKHNTGLPLARGQFLPDTTANHDSFAEVAAVFSAQAANILKICRDLRFLHYEKEITLAPMQAGSSIMPGKINPVLLEAAMNAALQVQAHASLVGNAVSLGSLQINEFLPLIGFRAIESAILLTAAADWLKNAVETLSVNEDVCRRKWEDSSRLITAFVSYLGYKKCEEIVTGYDGKKSFKEYLISILGEETVDRCLTPEALMSLGDIAEDTWK
ncbi:MAG: lyase family protein [Fibrobacterota bacterium]